MINSLPLLVQGKICKGFQRGSNELGIPTANLDDSQLPPDFRNGIYFGWAQIGTSPVYKSVSSIGFNPYYKNQKRSIETHLIHQFNETFYGLLMKLVIVGFIRPEKTFPSLDSLIAEIKNDISIANGKLEEPIYAVYRSDAFFSISVNDTEHQYCKTKL